ncbi:oligosaccharide repeat unit polymerase [Marinobacter sp. es.048]|uniref:O-antigen polymerase n=1 Tax=Marinobacter sp. es.048 TaxID=1761795 RepID=UPI000B594693|nr:O-antigen polymerase [Marinobacter sp. es.048]SNC66960.1 oligosaccharide repeat unit polymerase [Marinobacter sp. es.048]
MLIISLYFLFYVIVFRLRYPIVTFICFMFSLSFISAWLIGRNLQIKNWSDLANLSFSLLVLSCFALSFCSCAKKPTFTISNKNFFRFFAVILAVLLAPAIVINVYIVIGSLDYVLSGNVSITQFKNQGEAAELIRSWIDPNLVFYANLVSGLGVISIFYHFYYLNQKRGFLTVFYFIVSLNLPLVGLHGLSRASIVHFILMYSCLYLYVYQALDRGVRRKFNVLLALIGFVVLIAFLLITYYRFSDSTFYQISEGAIVQNKVIYSIFDYFSQWINNGLIVMNRFSLNDLWLGKSSISLFDYVLERLGFHVQSYVELRSDTLGIYGSRFNGLVATLVYDYSYVGVLVFLAAFSMVVKMASSSGAFLNGYSLPLIGFLLSIPALFFSNNYLSNEIFSLSGLYAAVFLVLSKVRFPFSLTPRSTFT